MSDVRRAAAALEVRGLDVYYGHSHALQGVDLTLDAGVFSVVGRNGMGKTTLCKTIMGLVPRQRRLDPRSRRGHHAAARRRISRVSASAMCRRDAGCGARSASTSICGLPAGMRRGAWTVERIYETFPRLAERKNHGGGQLSGGEQQMLAISRALLTNPHLLIMDEPTEGLAPVIVAQVEEMLVRLGEDGDISVLVIEQNIGVATAISNNVAIMVNGRINRIIEFGAAGGRPRAAAAPARRRPSRRTYADLDVPATGTDAKPSPQSARPAARSGSTSPTRHRRPAGRNPRRSRASRRRRARSRRGRAARGAPRAASASRNAPGIRTAGRAGRRHARHQGRRSCASSATSSPKAACARGWSTSPPAASSRPATSRRRRSRSTTGAAARPCSAPTAAPR